MVYADEVGSKENTVVDYRKLVGRWLAEGASADEALARLLRENERRGRPVPDAEVERLVGQAPEPPPPVGPGGSPGWAWFDRQVVFGNAGPAGPLGPYALLVYMVLVAHADEQRRCWPSQARLADLCHISRRKVIAALQELVDAGLVAKAGDPASGKVLHYTLSPSAPPVANSDRSGGGPVTKSDRSPPDLCTTVTPPVHHGNTHLCTTCTLNDSQKNKSQEHTHAEGVCESSSSIPRTGQEVPPEPEGFARFWDAYPRKTRRDDALAAWRRLNPSPELVRAILAAVADQSRSKQWQRDVVPNPDKWLRERRWTDRLPGPGGTSTTQAIFSRQQADEQTRRNRERAERERRESMTAEEWDAYQRRRQREEYQAEAERIRAERARRAGRTATAGTGQEG
jgi:hypothetical protein